MLLKHCKTFKVIGFYGNWPRDESDVDRTESVGVDGRKLGSSKDGKEIFATLARGHSPTQDETLGHRFKKKSPHSTM